jgi:hypothetical protein
MANPMTARTRKLAVALIWLVVGYFVVALIYPFFIPHRTYRLPRTDDEESAINVLTDINEAFQRCSKVRADGPLPATLQQLQHEVNDPTLVNDPVGMGAYGDYNYTYHLRSTHNDGKLDGFEAVAEPEFKDPDGRRSFYIDETGVIRVESNKRPTGKSPPLKHPS